MLTTFPSVTPPMWQLPTQSLMDITTTNISNIDAATLAIVNAEIAALGGGSGIEKYGFYRVDANVNASFNPNVFTELSFTPTNTIDTQTGPTLGHNWWDGSRVRSFPSGSTFMLNVVLGVVPDIINGNLHLVVGPTLTPPYSNTCYQDIIVDSGNTQMVTFSFPIGVQTPFYTGGGIIGVNPTVPITVNSIILGFYPWSLA